MKSIQSTGAARQTAATGGQYSTFYVGDLFFGVDVLQVQEVLRYQQMTRVPLAPEVVEGLINLRGEIVTAIDMRRRLGLEARAEGTTPMNMVVRTGGGAVSLLVDGIGDVIEVTADTFENVPDNVEPRIRELLGGVHKLDGRLLLVLDIEKTIALAAVDSGKAG